MLLFSKQVMLLITAVAVAQLVESWIVIPVVVGSSPIGHPKIPLLFKALSALITFHKAKFGTKIPNSEFTR